MRVVAVRVSHLRSRHEVVETRRYQGCVSWVELDAPIDVSGAEPTLTSAVLAERIVGDHALFERVIFRHVGRAVFAVFGVFVGGVGGVVFFALVRKGWCGDERVHHGDAAADGSDPAAYVQCGAAFRRRALYLPVVG